MNTEVKFYKSKNIKKLFHKPSWLYFIPFIGYYIFSRDLIAFQEEAGLFDTKTPGGDYFNKVNNKMAVCLNIFLPIYMFLSLVLFNWTFFVWKRICKKAIKLNENALLYKDFAQF